MQLFQSKCFSNKILWNHCFENTFLGCILLRKSNYLTCNPLKGQFLKNKKTYYFLLNVKRRQQSCININKKIVLENLTIFWFRTTKLICSLIPEVTPLYKDQLCWFELRITLLKIDIVVSAVHKIIGAQGIILISHINSGNFY